jgi:pimeloyl-ACP methyl ester carboxylesterase
VDGREPLSAQLTGGELRGWIAGDGPPVLLLHGGPGYSGEYLEQLGAELRGGVRIAAFQQRGLAPSTLEGPFTPRAFLRVVPAAGHYPWLEAPGSVRAALLELCDGPA